MNQAEACERLMDLGSFDVFMLAGRYTLLEQGALDGFLPRCVRRRVGRRSPPRSTRASSSPGPRRARATTTYRLRRRFGARRRIEAVARRHGVPLAAAALQFVLGHPAVISVIPGGGSRAEAEQNAAWGARPSRPRSGRSLVAERLLRADAPCPGRERVAR